MFKLAFYLLFSLYWICSPFSMASTEMKPGFEFKIECFLGRNSNRDNRFESTIPLKKRAKTISSVYEGYLQESVEVKIKSNNGKIFPVEVIPSALIVYSSMNRPGPHFTVDLSLAAKMSKGNLFETGSELLEYSETEMNSLSFQFPQGSWFKVAPAQVLKGDLEGKIKKGQNGRYDFFEMKIIGHCELLAKKN